MKADQIKLNTSLLPTAPCLWNPTVFHTLINRHKATERHRQGPEHICSLWEAWLLAQCSCLALNEGVWRQSWEKYLGELCVSLALTTVPYKLKTNSTCTLIIYEWFLQPKPYPSVKNSFVRFSYLEKPAVRLSEIDKLLRIGKRW